MYRRERRRRRLAIFEYICDHVIPGCTTKVRAQTPEAVREEARRHLEEHHGMEYLDADWTERLNSAILPVRS